MHQEEMDCPNCGYAIPAEVLPEPFVRTARAKINNRKVKVHRGRKKIPTACRKCGTRCDGRREALSHCKKNPKAQEAARKRWEDRRKKEAVRRRSAA